MNIERYLVSHDVKITGQQGDEIRCLCPFHTDTRTSFSINSKTGKWICFANCGFGGLVTLVQKLDNCSKEEATKKVGTGDSSGSKKFSILKKVSRMQSLLNEYRALRAYKIELPKRYSPILDKDDCPEYLLSRLKFKTIKKFKLGIADFHMKERLYRNMIIIPIILRKEIYGYQARNMSDKNRFYLMPEGFPIKQFFFNYDIASEYETVYITEGAFDAMSMDEKEYPNVMASFNASFISTHQFRLLLGSRIRHIVFCYDNDEAGRKGIKRSLETLKQFFKISYVKFPKGRDANKLNKEQLDYVIQRRTKKIV